LVSAEAQEEWGDLERDEAQARWYNERFARTGVWRDHPLNPEIWMSWWTSNKAYREVFLELGIDGPVDLLDIGCGSGSSLISLQPILGTRGFSGIEIDERRVEGAQAALPKADIRHGDAGDMPWSDGTFTVTFMSPFFGPITSPETRRRIGAEMVRVTKDGGYVITGEWHYTRPGAKDFRGTRLKEMAQILDGTDFVTKRKGPLVPPLGRLVSKRAPWTYMALMHVPFLSAMTVSAWRKRPSSR